MIEAAEARQLFVYDQETGVLTWDVTKGAVKRGRIAGSKSHTGYLHVMVDGRFYQVHRVIYLMCHGRWPKHGIDHINGDPLDNRLINIRDVPSAVNSQNMRRTKRNTSGVVGVRYNEAHQKWHSTIRHNNVRYWLGYFNSFDAAVKARKRAERDLCFGPNHGRDK